MASRATRSFLSRRPVSLSSINRLLPHSSCTSTSTTILSEEVTKKLYDVTPRRYFGFYRGVGGGTMNNSIGQTYSLASLNSRFTYQLSQSCRTVQRTHSLCRSFASRSASEPPNQKQTQEKKAISTVEDPFDSPTYHIPEKPVTFTEGASYSLVILVGLGIAAAAAYGVCKELIFEPKEYKIFSKALDRVQGDSQVRVRIGSPIIGYGQETRNRSARQRISHREWIDQDGVEHIEINFYVRGPQGNGKVFCEMFKDKVDKQWKYMYLIVNILHPREKQLFLESFLPA